jgi:hypothetical protein
MRHESTWLSRSPASTQPTRLKLPSPHLHKKIHKDLQITLISFLQTSNVVRPRIAIDHQRKPLRPNENQRCKRTGDAPVAVLKWVDLGQTMVQPGRLDFWRDSLREWIPA